MQYSIDNERMDCFVNILPSEIRALLKADDGGHGGTVTTQIPDPSAITRQLTSLFLRLGCGMI